ncbi:MAG: hypothetical protein AAB400_01870 [Patescibacteria group bacterium]
MDQVQQPAKQQNYGMIGLVIGIVLAIAFIVIGSVFFGLKPGPSTPTNSSDTIDPSLYAPTQ